MLLSCIAKWNEADPGKLLVDFLYYFGFYYEYQYEINQNANKMSLYQYDINSDEDQYVMALHILDPINPTNNVGTLSLSFRQARESVGAAENVQDSIFLFVFEHPCGKAVEYDVRLSQDNPFLITLSGIIYNRNDGEEWTGGTAAEAGTVEDIAGEVRAAEREHVIIQKKIKLYRKENEEIKQGLVRQAQLDTSLLLASKELSDSNAKLEAAIQNISLKL